MVEVIVLTGFLYAGTKYVKNQVTHFDKRTAEMLIRDGKVSTGSIFSSNNHARAKATVPELVIDIKPVDITGSFYN